MDIFLLHVLQIYYYCFVVLVTGLLFMVLHLFNHRRSQRLSLRIADCSTFLIMYDVLSIAVACSESIECFPGVASKLFILKILLFRWPHLLLVWSYISCSTFIVPLYIYSCILVSFSASFCVIFLFVGTAIYISTYICSFLFLIIIVIFVVIIITIFAVVPAVIASVVVVVMVVVVVSMMIIMIRTTIFKYWVSVSSSALILAHYHLHDLHTRPVL